MTLKWYMNMRDEKSRYRLALTPRLSDWSDIFIILYAYVAGSSARRIIPELVY